MRPKENMRKEFYAAMQSGDMEAVIERHGDRALLEFLQYYEGPYYQSIRGLFWPFANYDPNTPSSQKAWVAIGNSVKATSLPLLLEFTSLNKPRLSHAVRSGMIKKLTLASKEDLECLTSEQRRQLVHFTLRQLEPLVTRAPYLKALRWQAATLGYLALAMLKEPGAERPNRSGLTITHANLGKAIDEYHAALKETV